MRFRLVAVGVLTLMIGGAARGDTPVASKDAPATPAVKDPAEPSDEVLYACKEKTGEVAVTFKPETEVKDLVTWVMGFTCKNFVLDPRILSTGRKVSLIVPNKMSTREAYRTFLVALSTIGLTVVPKGEIMRIVEAKTAGGETLPIYSGAPGDADQVVRTVIKPNYATPETLRTAFTAVKSDVGSIAVVGSMLVVTDFASSITNMLSLKKLVDVPGGTEGIYTIPVRHGDATKIGTMLIQMFQASSSSGSAQPARPVAGQTSPGVGQQSPVGGQEVSELAPSKILIDDRTNTIVVSASEAAYQRAKALVERIDVAVDLEGGGAIHVYQLQSAIALDLAETINRAISGDTAPKPSPTTVTTPGGNTVTRPTPAQPSAPATSPALDALGQSLQGKVHIMPDNATNKLLITSSSHDFLAVRDVIRELDQPRRQVYIEALILEVSADNDSTLGFSAHGAIPGTGLALGGVQLSNLKSTDPASLASATGLIGGLLGAPLPASVATMLGTGTSIPSYGVLVQALAHAQNANIVSAPSIIALDNEQATSKIGRNIPYQNGTIPSGTGASAITTTSISRQPLELDLEIKPHISAGDTVLLEIKHTDAGVEDLTGALGPTWSTRDIETRVVVRDQQTIVIGGLMQMTESEDVTKVPILGDIPLLGHLFRSTTKTKHKKNLLVMLTPYIVRDQLEIQQIQERKMREHAEFFGSMNMLATAKFDAHIDYAKKRGLVEEINRSVMNVDEDIAARRAMSAPTGVQEGRVELGSPN